MTRRYRKTPFALAAALLLALPVAAQAQEEEEEGPFSWNAAITSDYVFRGASQSDENPAIQLGFDYELGSGFYVGVWGSTVDFGPGSPSVEIDTYIGWNHDISDAWNFDLMLNRYNYFGEDRAYGDSDYLELIGALTYAEMLTFTLGYSNDVWATGENGWYYGINTSVGIGNGFNLDLGGGWSAFDDATGVEDYADWMIGINRDFGSVNIALGYYDTGKAGDYNFGDTGDGRVVLTFSIGG
ncbi:TorF family putative porin [Arenimonas composti]|uniref:Uncharacterized protein n=1 Tax=Arenimonas composti TR7-09 = DSM 18010 TaxID=1121013 RepID=A0A091BZ74_9GAMM|nr:TorF family putative porin [Arenimonas composti]KFN49675.1 hypothetical protein P873_09920 [Arenimonas composti TR7-09 = DSM 18010]